MAALTLKLHQTRVTRRRTQLYYGPNSIESTGMQLYAVRRKPQGPLSRDEFRAQDASRTRGHLEVMPMPANVLSDARAPSPEGLKVSQTSKQGGKRGR
ncbi:hypothetical protein DPEC_G00235580 [Dallia pectoralis]|uniref:Uncharacterized protein n=1 Tax=Dallia pectoralis TaxID=75939 RepID=A0ACC2FY64_DALPE|nr:hypothetical protein DPEC_G00235580 [Dallia pectoralis]